MVRVTTVVMKKTFPNTIGMKMDIVIDIMNIGRIEKYKENPIREIALSGFFESNFGNIAPKQTERIGRIENMQNVENASPK